MYRLKGDHRAYYFDIGDVKLHRDQVSQTSQMRARLESIKVSQTSQMRACLESIKSDALYVLSYLRNRECVFLCVLHYLRQSFGSFAQTHRHRFMLNKLRRQQEIKIKRTALSLPFFVDEL